MPESLVGPIETCVVAVDKPSVCPNPDCRSTNVRLKGKEPNRRTILHSEGGQLKRIILIRPRCECRDCKTTFYPDAHDFSGNSPFTEAAENNITTAILQHPEISVHRYADDLEKSSGLGSSSAIDRLIKKRVKDFSAAVEPVSCTKLFYIPFKYKSRTDCCAIVGLQRSEKKMFLLDILPDSGSDTISSLFQKIASSNSDVRLFLADLNAALLASIKTHYQGRVGVLRGLILRLIDSYKDKHFAMDRKFEAIESLKKVVLKELKEQPYYEEFETWKNEYLSSNPELASQLTPLYNEMFSLKKECWNGTFHCPWEREFSMLLGIIGMCEKNNTSFDFMAFRLLYANRAATKTLEGSKILRCIQNINEPVVGPIRSFGVDIKKLNEEFFDEEDYINKLIEEKSI